MEFKYISFTEQFCSFTVRGNPDLAVLTIYIGLCFTKHINLNSYSLICSDAYVIMQLTSSCKAPKQYLILHKLSLTHIQRTELNSKSAKQRAFHIIFQPFKHSTRSKSLTPVHSQPLGALISQKNNLVSNTGLHSCSKWVIGSKWMEEKEAAMGIVIL